MTETARLVQYQFERAEPEETFVDRSINRSIDEYMQTLSLAEWRDFNEDAQNMSLGERITKICNALGERSGGIEKSEAAINLKSMHLVRYLDGVISRGNGAPSREYYLHVENDSFWTQVDGTAQFLYRMLAHEKYNVELEPIDHSHDTTEAWTAARQTLGELGGYRLIRQTSSAHDQLLDVRYITETIAAT